MMWGILQTEAYATVILRQVVDFLGVPDDVPAGVAKRMERQQVLYNGDHHFDVILGEQALYTNIGGPEVLREQMERLLQDIDLPSLSLGVHAATAEVSAWSRRRSRPVASRWHQGTQGRPVLPSVAVPG
ncbi:Scr1 family TA system antitoxin-like transcriptional regulator [Streptomyces mirabilis]|uniref:Scr1 family TA system antitoxin-like transcriptional regulator n=1 Tax=Streptomyces mirabilis TaxID=68239 RepID=UPI0036B09C9C